MRALKLKVKGYYMQNKKTLRATFHQKALAYHTWSAYLSLGIAIVVLPILGILGLEANIELFVLILTIVTHIKAKKMLLASKMRHVGPILLYVSEALSLLAIGPFLIEIAIGGEGHLTLGLAVLIILPIRLTSAVFFFLSAKQMKAAYPEMKMEMQVAKAEFQEAKRAFKKGL